MVFFAGHIGNGRGNYPQAVQVTLLENGERYRHAVKSGLCGIDRCMKRQVHKGHVTPIKFNMAANTAAKHCEQQLIVILVEKC